MLVKEIMNKDVATCTPPEDLASASRVMQEYNCGFVPVVDNQGKVAGVVTDRDICLAVGSNKIRAVGTIPLTETMSHPVYTCNPNENIKVALAIMAKHRVRRLPVVDENGHLEGILSVDDVVRMPHVRGMPTSNDIVEALRGVIPTRTIPAVLV